MMTNACSILIFIVVCCEVCFVISLTSTFPPNEIDPLASHIAEQKTPSSEHLPIYKSADAVSTTDNYLSRSDKITDGNKQKMQFRSRPTERFSLSDSSKLTNHANSVGSMNKLNEANVLKDAASGYSLRANKLKRRPETRKNLANYKRNLNTDDRRFRSVSPPVGSQLIDDTEFRESRYLPNLFEEPIAKRRQSLLPYLTRRRNGRLMDLADGILNSDMTKILHSFPNRGFEREREDANEDRWEDVRGSENEFRDDPSRRWRDRQRNTATKVSDRSLCICMEDDCMRANTFLNYCREEPDFADNCAEAIEFFGLQSCGNGLE